MTDGKAKTGTLNPSSNLTGKKTALSHTFHTNTIILPRQARTKHRETNQKGGGFLAGGWTQRLFTTPRRIAA